MVEWLALAIVLIFLGMFLVVLALLLSARDRAEAGGVVIIGPLPIVFGTSQKIAMSVMILAILLTLLALLLFLSFPK